MLTAERASSAYLPPRGASVLCMESRMLLIPQTRGVENTCASRIYILC